MTSPPPSHHPDTIRADTTRRRTGLGAAPARLIVHPVPAFRGPAAAGSARTAGRSRPDAAHSRPTTSELAGDRRIAGVSISQCRRPTVLGRIGLLLFPLGAGRSARNGDLRAGRPVSEGCTARDRQQPVSPLPDPAAVRAVGGTVV